VEKSDFNNGGVTFDDFVYQVNSKRVSNAFGRDDLEGRSRRVTNLGHPVD
jgi:hypothetical protein